MATEREASICTAKDATIMTLGFFYGDELSRWLYRQYVDKFVNVKDQRNVIEKL